MPGAQLALLRDGQTLNVTAGHDGTGRPVDWTKRFPFGSVSKPFTATVAMQLAADGDVDLDAPVSDHVAELRGHPPGEATLRQLLSHTSGLVADHELAGATSRRYVLSLLDQEQVGPPGVFSYSNAGYVLAGRLIESVTGMSWWDAVETFVAGPAELSLTGLADLSVVTPHAVTGDRVVAVRTELPAAWEPAGGVAGTALDLVGFARLHFGAGPDFLLDDNTAALMREPAAAEPFGVAAGWGLGWGLYDGGWIGHDGTLAGSTCALRFHPNTSTVLALTTNASTGLLVWPDLLAALAEAGLVVGDYAPMAVAKRRPGGELTEYIGEYVNGQTCFRVTAPSSGTLRLDDGTGFEAVLTHADADVFAVRRLDAAAPDHVGRFLRDPVTGRVRSLQFSGRLAGFREPAVAGSQQQR